MMKKIFALLVVLAMVFCFAACGEPTPETPETPETPACTEHIDNDGDGICDTAGCGATVEKKDDSGDSGNTGNTPVDSAQAGVYANAIFAAIESAKTVTATIDMTSIQGESEMVAADGKVVEEGYLTEMTVHFDVTLAMGENGLNIKITGTGSESHKYGDEEAESILQKLECYIVDYVAYSRIAEENGEWEEWNVNAIEIPEDANGMIAQLAAIITELVPADFEVTPEMIDEIKATIADTIAALMTVNSDGSFGAKVDAKVAIDAVIGFIKEIKAEETIGSVINKVLAIIDPEMTIETILDEAAMYGSVTVGEIYTAIDEACVAEFDMSINDMKNAILAEESIVSIIIESGVIDEETLAAIAKTDIELMMAEYAEITVDDIVYMMFAAQSAPEPEARPISDEPIIEEPVDTTGMLAAMVGEIKGMLATTIEVATNGEYDTIMTVLNDIDVKANYIYITFKIADDLSIEKIEFGQKIDMTATTPTVTFEKVETGDGEADLVPIEGTITVTMKQDVVFTITSVSNVETTITAPEVAE